MDNFKYAVSDSFAASGVTYTKAQIKALQVALNQKWGASPKLVEDGIIGSNTKQALVNATGISYPPSLDDYNAVLAGNSSSESSESSAPLTTAQLKVLWAKSKDRFGGLNKKSGLTDAENFDKWLKRQAQVAGLKDFGKGLFQVGTDWLKNKQSGVTNDAGSPDDDAPLPTDDKILGMPKPVFYIGLTVVGGLLIWAIVALAKGGSKTVVVQQAPAVVPAG